jgi:putative addiction module component (TIGR02574 family)
MDSIYRLISGLTVPEKLQLVEDLWDDIAAHPDAVPLKEWQREELDRRKAALQRDPCSGSDWETVKQRIRARYGR